MADSERHALVRQVAEHGIGLPEREQIVVVAYRCVPESRLERLALDLQSQAFSDETAILQRRLASTKHAYWVGEWISYASPG